ncbi:armadillo-type protein, partial [Jimgerdemannia flammicorona]
KTEPNPGRDAWIETLLRDTVGSHLLERILRCSSAPIFNTLYASYFRGRIQKLCAHPIANFVVQAMFVNARSEVQLAMMIEEAAEGFETFLKQGKPGVIRSIIDACVKVNACHKEAVKGLCAAVRCNAPAERKEFVNCVLRMWTYETWINASPEDRASPKTHHTQGALILQSVLTLPEEYNAIVVNSFLAQPHDVTFPWTREPIASRVIDSILTSPHVNLKAKRKLLRNYMGHYHEFAMDKYGGHVVDRCWAVADIDMKEKIAAELLDHEHALSQSFYGRFILRNCKIDSFKRRRDEWIEHERGAQRKKEMFKDILGDVLVIKGSKPNGADAVALPANPNIASLGFEKGELAGLEEAEKKKKKKKGKKSVAEHIEKMFIEEDKSLGVKGKYDEIDALFKKSKSKKRKQGHREEAEMESEAEAEADEVMEKDIEEKPVKEGKKQKRKDMDLMVVLEAIGATKKKRRKEVAEDGEKAGKAAKTEV